ncbi:MAG: AsmA family protein [Povalibacter sp.]
MRIVKIAAYVVGALIALIVVAIVLVVLFVDPNDYRDEIAARVEQQTGRKLTLSGNLKLSFFPWLALETGPASLSDAPGFGDEPFVSINEARISVRLLPLLRGKLEVGQVKLSGARIRLVTDAQGRTNWSDLGEQKPSDAAPTDKPATLPTIAGLEISDAAITMEDRKVQSRRVVRDFNLQTGRLESGQPFELKTGFVFDQDASLSVKVHLATTVTADLERNVHRLADPEIDVTVSGHGYPPEGVPVQIRAKALTTDIGRKAYQLDGFTLTTTWKGDGFPAEGVPVRMQAQQLAADLAAQTLDLTEFGADVAGAKLSGALKGSEIVDAPRIGGSLRLETLSPREWLPKLGIKLPTTSDPNVFKQLSFVSQLALTKNSAELNDVQLKLDDTTAKGSLGVANLETKALRFNLDIDRINADRYLAPPSKVPAKKEKSPPVEIPIEMLRTLNARGDLRVGEAIFAGVKFTQLRLGVNARDGQVRFNPSEASMYSGTYRGDIAIDATADTARVSMDQHVNGVQFAPLFKDLFQSERFSGKGTLNAKLAGRGRNSDELMNTLDGTLDFNVADGALEGADLWYEIRRARALLKQQAAPERTGPARTTFEAMKGTGVMKNGVLSNNDLDVSMQYLKVSGKGTLDVPKSAIDYQLLASVLKIPQEGADPAQMQDLVDAQIPVKVTGALDDPKVRPDIQGLLKGRVKEELKKEQGKVEQKLKDKLKDLFGH